MIEYLKSLSLYLVVSVLIFYGSSAVDSDYFFIFLKENLITLLVALLAINNTTFSVVMTKLREISDQNGGDFAGTISEFKKSNIEQIFFIIAAILLLIFKESELLKVNGLVSSICEIGLITIFIASLHNLYDTGNSIFVILSFENKN
jgi:hypothetical protein